MKRVLIIGAGGHGQVVADILLAARQKGASEVPIGFLDDDERVRNTVVLGLPVLGPIAQVLNVRCDGVFVAIGDNQTRQRLTLALKEQGLELVNAIHPTAVIASDVRLGSGIAVCAGVVVNTGSSISDGVILNTGCTVDHHNRVGAYVHVAPGVNLAGNVTLGKGAFLGVGTVVIPGRLVGDWTTVGAGSIVTKDLRGECVAAGAPARVIGRRQHEEKEH